MVFLQPLLILQYTAQQPCFSWLFFLCPLLMSCPSSLLLHTFSALNMVFFSLACSRDYWGFFSRNYVTMHRPIVNLCMPLYHHSTTILYLSWCDQSSFEHYLFTCCNSNKGTIYCYLWNNIRHIKVHVKYLHEK